MKILIEGYPYKEADVKPILKGFEPFSKDGKISVNNVGYFYSKEISDCIFFLPKVVMNEKGYVLNNENLYPKTILDIDKALDDKILSLSDYRFIYNFSVWIFRAVKEFYRLNKDSEIILRKSFSLLDRSQNEKDATLLDIILSLIKFNNDNQDFFMFTIKNIHCGYNKINWNKTISKSNAIMQSKIPIYLNPVNKKKQINFDEELLIIFFSILSHLSDKYGFCTPINYNYELIKASAFENYLAGYGKIRLRQIKYKYFSDKALLLWELCYAFFEASDKIKSSEQDCDYLLAKNFNIVFEAIIDELIGDNKDKLPKELHDQPDGKIVDHIFRYNSLTNDNDIYYIGDSKYYKIGGSLGGNSIAKQYTYAKNVIQFNINWFYEGKEHIRYRDDLTEGYNITPNFFISAEVPKDLSYSTDNLKLRDNEKDKRQVFHFPNRLFDRDTLWLSHYDVNFLYIIALYARANDFEKQSFKSSVKNQFKQHIISLLNEKYEFCVLEPKDQYSLKRAIDINFKRLYGKVFCPFENKSFVVLSLEKEANENAQIKEEIKPYFFIHEDYQLGNSIDEILVKKQSARKSYIELLEEENFFSSLAAEPAELYNATTIERIFTDNSVSRESLKSEYDISDFEINEITSIENELVLVGYYNGEKQFSEIIRNHLYYVRTGFRSGSIQLVSGFEECKYLFLHYKQEKYMFKLKGVAPKLYTGSQLTKKGFDNKSPEESYLGFELADDKPLQFTDVELSNAITRGIANRSADSYFTTLKELFGL